MDRRGFLKLGIAAPAVILTPGLLMPVRSFAKPLLTADLILKELLASQGTKLAIYPTQLIITNTLLWPGVKIWWDAVYGSQSKEIHYKDFYLNA